MLDVRPFSRRLGLALPALAFCLLASGSEPPLPPLEPWGDLRRPYGDSLAAAAERALGPRAAENWQEGPGISLEDFYSLQMSERERRERVALAICQRAITLKRTDGVDDLELHLEALRTAPNTIQAYAAAVRILLDRGDLVRSKPLAVQAIRLEPRDEVLWALLGEVYRQAGAPGKARTALEHAARLDGGRRSNATEALLVLYLSGNDLVRADSLQRATPGGWPSWLAPFTRAKQARERGDPQAALEALHEATGPPGAPAAVFVELATLEQERGNLDGAERAYTRALQLAPHENAAHTGLGLIQMARGDLEGAAARFAARVRQSPADSTAQFNLGRVSLQIAAASPARAESAYASAEAAFAACIDAQYNEASARLGRAQARWGRGDLEGAAGDARCVLDSPSHAGRARLLLARVALTQGKPQEAVEHLQPLMQAQELDANGWAMLGKAQLELGQPERAHEALEKARAGAPGELHVAINYAVALSQLGRLEEAETLLRELAGEHPSNPTVLQNLAAVLHRQGRDAEAEALLERAERLQPR